MSQLGKTVDELISSLKQQRDELRVKIHLGSTELKQELSQLENRLDELTRKYDPLKHALSDTSADVWSSMKLVGEEIAKGFDRIRKSL